MAGSVENKNRDVSDTAEFARPGRLLLDTLAEIVLNIVIFVFRFIGWTLRWSVATVVMLVVMAGAGLYVFNNAVEGGEPVTVPNVTGMDYAQASRLLLDMELTMSPPTQMESDRVPVGHIISQRPEAGRVIRSRRPVHTTVSRGAVERMAPSLVGKRVSEVHSILTDAGFNGTQEEAHITHAAIRDTVLAQDPPAGESLPEGGTIRLLVSNGPYSGMLLPDLTNMTLEEAVDVLEKMNVEPVPVRRARADAPIGKVYEQDTAPGTVVTTGTKVQFYINPDPNDETAEEIHRQVFVTLTIPGLGQNHTVEFKGIPKDSGEPLLLLSQRVQGGSTMTFQFRYLEEATLVVEVDGQRYRSYYYQGDMAPVVTNYNEDGSAAFNG